MMPCWDLNLSLSTRKRGRGVLLTPPRPTKIVAQSKTIMSLELVCIFYKNFVIKRNRKEKCFTDENMNKHYSLNKFAVYDRPHRPLRYRVSPGNLRVVVAPACLCNPRSGLGTRGAVLAPQEWFRHPRSSFCIFHFCKTKNK